MGIQTAIHKELQASIDLIYVPAGFECTTPIAEHESAEYGAYSFLLNKRTVLFRVAKITPTKMGQFVTLWKRSKDGPIEPFSVFDDIDYVIICAREGDLFGQFIFPKTVLMDKGVFSTQAKEGKRAIRVYPPWSAANNKQAQQTQKWQLNYFLDVAANKLMNFARVKQLFGVE